MRTTKLKLHSGGLIFTGLIFILTIGACKQQAENDYQGFQLAKVDSLQVFGEGLISTHLNERDIAISPNGDEIYYSIVSPRNRVSYIVQLVKKDEVWSSPKMASFSGKYPDLEPAFHPSGEELYFASKRPLEGEGDSKDYDIWKVSKMEDGSWSKAMPVGSPVNTDKDEYYPSLALNGNIYYTASYEDSKGSEDIYMSEWKDGSYQTPISLSDSINTATFEFNAYIAPDEGFLIFGSFGRQDGEGGGDLYISERDKNGNWLGARHLGNEINSKGLDYCPFVDLKNEQFYFTSDRTTLMEPTGENHDYNEFVKLLDRAGNGNGDIYVVSFSEIGVTSL